MSIILDRRYEGHEAFATLLKEMQVCLDPNQNPAAGFVPKQYTGSLRVTVEFLPDVPDLPPREVIREGTQITVRYPGWSPGAAWTDLMGHPPEGAVPAFGPSTHTRTGCNGARRLWRRDHKKNCPVWIYDPENPQTLPPNWDPKDKTKSNWDVKTQSRKR